MHRCYEAPRKLRERAHNDSNCIVIYEWLSEFSTELWRRHWALQKWSGSSASEAAEGVKGRRQEEMDRVSISETDGKRGKWNGNRKKERQVGTAAQQLQCRTDEWQTVVEVQQLHLSQFHGSRCFCEGGKSSYASVYFSHRNLCLLNAHWFMCNLFSKKAMNLCSAESLYVLLLTLHWILYLKYLNGYYELYAGSSAFQLPNLSISVCIP